MGKTEIGHQKYSIPTFEACAQAADLLRTAGFELRTVSTRSEATYYGWPGRQALIRVAAHSKSGRMHGTNEVVARITFNGTHLDLPGEIRISSEKIRKMVSLAIGTYMIRSSERKVAVEGHHVETT